MKKSESISLLDEVASAEKELDRCTRKLAQAEGQLEANLNRLNSLVGTRDIEESERILENLRREYEESKTRIVELIEEVKSICNCSS